MNYKETAAIVYRIVSAYPFQARNISDEMLEDMVREWHDALRNIKPDGAMEAVTSLISEQKWMPSLAEIVSRILDVQYGTDDAIITELNRVILRASECIIFGRVTEEQKEGYRKLTDFQKQIINSPYDFNLWLKMGHEWKQNRVQLAKRMVQSGKALSTYEVKALEGEGNGQDQQQR